MRLLFKGLQKGMRSSFDPSFVYIAGEWNVHPNPDTKSTGACGRGLHLCKRIRDIPHYVGRVKFVCLANYRGKLGEDEEKIRVKAVLLTGIVPWAKLAPLYRDYQQKRAPLDQDYEQKRAPLDQDYAQKLRKKFL